MGSRYELDFRALCVFLFQYTILCQCAEKYFLNMTSIDNVSSIIVPAGTPFVQWNISIQCYPQPYIEWGTLDRDNNLDKIVIDGNRYESDYNEETNLTFLKIKNVAIEDTGFYQIIASNGKTEADMLSLFLNVTDRPRPHRLQLATNPFLLINTPSIVKCTAIANPQPQFEWEHKDCDTDECDFVSINATTVYPSKYYFYEFTSVTSIIPSKSGSIKCSTRNSEGFNSTTEIYNVSDVKDGLDVFGLDSRMYYDEDTNVATVAIGDPFQVTCGASFSHYSNITWFLNGTILENRNRLTISSSSTQYSRRHQLTIEPVEFSDIGRYTCMGTGLNGAGDGISVIYLRVTHLQSPMIVTNMKDIIDIYIHEPLTMICDVTGIPKPNVTWFKNDVQFKPSEPDRILVSEKNVYMSYENINYSLTFKYTDKKDEGTYKCEARNRIGVASKQQIIKFQNLPKRNPKWLIYIAIFTSILFLIAIAFILIKIRKEKHLQQELERLGLENFEKGAVQNINPELGIAEQAELLPYDPKYEIPNENVKIGQRLGSGAFGVVMKGEVKNIVEEEPITTVAIKMVRKDADYEYIKTLVSELKIMVHLGKHVNIVNLIGACTKNVAKRELMVIVEYCRFGNLQNYLLRHRKGFIDQVDMNTGQANFSIDLDFNSSLSISNSQCISSPSNSTENAQAVSTTIPEGESASPQYITSDFLNRNNPALSSTRSSREYRGNPQTGTPTIPEDELIVSNDTESEDVSALCTEDLLVWAFQVARGMEYLASRKIIHGDLAARNILLSDDNVVKICDFGLAKDMYKNYIYKKKSDVPMPLKWMAVESITHRIFSTQSDVWSFGIVLWEFFSLGGMPYPGIQGSEELYEFLINKARMKSPPYAPRKIYNMMTWCWEESPYYRPSFTKLSEEIGSLIGEDLRQYYIGLNEPYLKMNTQRLESGESDYLAIMNPPTFKALSTPHNLKEHIGKESDNNSTSRTPTEEDDVIDLIKTNKIHSEDGEGIETIPVLPIANNSTVTPNGFSNPEYYKPPTILEETRDDIVDDIEIVKTNIG